MEQINNPLVSVIIAAYNEEKHINKCISAGPRNDRKHTTRHTFASTCVHKHAHAHINARPCIYT